MKLQLFSILLLLSTLVVGQNQTVDQLVKSATDLVNAYQPHISTILTGKTDDKRVVITLKNIKGNFCQIKSGELIISRSYLQQLNLLENERWFEKYPQDADYIINKFVQNILRPSSDSPKWIYQLLSDYIRKRTSFNSNSSINNYNVKSPTLSPDFIRYIELFHDDQVIQKLSKIIRKQSDLSENRWREMNKKRWIEYKTWVKNKQRIKQLWYPVSVSYKTCPDLEFFALRSKSLCEQFYPTLIEQLDSQNFEPFKTVHLIFKEMEGVAATGGNYIHYSQEFYRKNPTDFGSVIHELTHVVQKAPAYDPVWVIESTADYMRYLHGYRDGRTTAKGGSYLHGYQRGADFLRYIELTYQLKDFVKALNAEVRAKTLYVNPKSPEAQAKQLVKIDKFFIKQTKKSVNECWSDYQNWIDHPNRSPLWRVK